MTENHPQDQPAEGGQQYSGQPPPPPPPPAQGYGQQPPAYGQQPQPPAYGQQPPVSPSDARMWSLFSHLGGLLLSPLVPLVIYLVYKERDPFVRHHSSQALNWQIWAYIGYAVSFVLMFVLIGFLTFAIIAVCAVVFGIMASVAANRGEEYTYPLIPALIK